MGGGVPPSPGDLCGLTIYFTVLRWAGLDGRGLLTLSRWLFFILLSFARRGSVPYELIIMDVLGGGCRSARLL